MRLSIIAAIVLSCSVSQADELMLAGRRLSTELDTVTGNMLLSEMQLFNRITTDVQGDARDKLHDRVWKLGNKRTEVTKQLKKYLFVVRDESLPRQDREDAGLMFTAKFLTLRKAHLSERNKIELIIDRLHAD